MKLILIALGACLLGASAAPQPKGLQEDFDELLALVPTEEIVAIVQDFANTDPEVQALILFLKGTEFPALLGNLHSTPEYVALKAELVDMGLDVDGLLQRLNEIFGGIVVPEKISLEGSRSVQDMMNAIAAIIPADEIYALLEDKKQNSPEFIAFWDRLSSVNTFNLVEAVRVLPESIAVDDALTALGFDPTAAFEDIYRVLGWPPAKH